MPRWKLSFLEARAGDVVSSPESVSCRHSPVLVGSDLLFPGTAGHLLGVLAGSKERCLRTAALISF
jgi:hypothetical protein